MNQIPEAALCLSPNADITLYCGCWWAKASNGDLSHYACPKFPKCCPGIGQSSRKVTKVKTPVTT